MKIRLTLIVMLLGLASCSTPIDAQKDLVGKWKSDLNRLELAQDGSFTYTVAVRSGNDDPKNKEALELRKKAGLDPLPDIIENEPLRGRWRLSENSPEIVWIIQPPDPAKKSKKDPAIQPFWMEPDPRGNGATARSTIVKAANNTLHLSERQGGQHAIFQRSSEN